MVSNRTAQVKICEISATVSAAHADDFTKYFSAIDSSLSAHSG